MPLRIKICGITQQADALHAVEAGADALGFMFYEASPRQVSLETGARIIADLPPFVAKVGVFVNASRETVLQAIETTGIDTLQFHGEEPPEFCQSFRGCKVIKAFRVHGPESVQSCATYTQSTNAWLLDSFVPDQRGGTGSIFNWDLAVQAKSFRHPILLAGGLTPENVAAAVRHVRPFGVDVSSGVESAPGKKDARKLQAFVDAALSA